MFLTFYRIKIVLEELKCQRCMIHESFADRKRLFTGPRLFLASSSFEGQTTDSYFG